MRVGGWVVGVRVSWYPGWAVVWGAKVALPVVKLLALFHKLQ